ncbi:MAG: hypothetical protein AAFR33_10335 [Pseudomonadota bacterium]
MGNLVWWILPAISGVIGLMLGFGGLGRLFSAQIFSGLLRTVFGVGFLGLAGVVAMAGLNLQTYKRLTYERDVMTISFADGGAPDKYIATVIYEGGETETYELTGDEWQVRARVIRFDPMSNMLGYDSVYRLDRLSGAFEEAVGDTTVVVHRLSENPGLDVQALAKAEGARWGLSTQAYGSGVYNPMADGLAYRVKMAQTGLVMEAGNAATQARIGKPNDSTTSGVGQ